jgi:hypothetical protein
MEGERTGIERVCERRGGNTENNNGVTLHKYQIWISVGESMTRLPAGKDNVVRVLTANGS